MSTKEEARKQAKLKNMLKPLVLELVKEALFSEQGILSSIIAECVTGLTKEVIVEKRLVPNVPVLHEAYDVDTPEPQSQAIIESDLEQAVRAKKVIQARDGLEKQRRMMQSTGFAKMFEDVAPLDETGVIEEGEDKSVAKKQQANAGPLRDVQGKGIDITGILAVARGGSQNWKNAIKE